MYTTFEQMISKYVKGEISRDDLYANMAARLIVLEEIHKGLKKRYRPSPGRRRNKDMYHGRFDIRREDGQSRQVYWQPSRSGVTPDHN